MNRLVLFARHVGYLHARPTDWPESGPHSRWEAHRQMHGMEPPLPPVERGQYLLTAWTDLGRVEVNPGLGRGALRFAEIAAGAPWTDEAERRVIRRMSQAYLEGLEIGADVLGIAPWEP